MHLISKEIDKYYRRISALSDNKELAKLYLLFNEIKEDLDERMLKIEQKFLDKDVEEIVVIDQGLKVVYVPDYGYDIQETDQYDVLKG